MSNFRERLMQFMRGRYGGNDTLNKFLFGVFLFFLLVAIFPAKAVRQTASLTCLPLQCWCIPISASFPRILHAGRQKTQSFWN